MGADGFDPVGNLLEDLTTPAHEQGDEAAHVAVFPGENRGIVLVTHARQAVHVVEDGVDVMLKGRDESWIGEKIHGVLFLFPCEKLAYAAECAGCAIA